MGGIRKGKQEADGDRFGAKLGDLGGRSSDVRLLKLSDDRPIGSDSLRYPKPQVSGHERSWARDQQVIDLGPGLTAYFDHVFESMGRY
jgi:hypothetical protein